VATATAALREEDRGWVRALMTHESAGVADAISPTGCAGPLAIQSCFACTPCCVSDERDRSSRIYDSCSWEESHGYLCDRGGDRRFRYGWATSVAARKLHALRGSLAGLADGDFSFAVALAVRWNAGSGSVGDFPHGLTSATAAVEKLRLLAVEPYRSWSPEDRWNKVVEVYDYALWLPLLERFWRSPDAAPGSTISTDGLRCFDFEEGRLVAAGRRSGPYRRVDIARLRLGRYLPDAIEVQ